jgi:hypothetical protein
MPVRRAMLDEAWLPRAAVTAWNSPAAVGGGNAEGNKAVRPDIDGD